MMRYAQVLAVVCVLAGAALASAQQQGGLGPPSAAPALGPMPAADATVAQPPPALGPQPTPVGPAPAQMPYAPQPYGMPPGMYGPPYGMPPGGYAPMAFPAAPVVPRDPANPMIWGGVEAILWWTKNQPVPIPLLTTGPAAQGAAAGNLGVPGTVSLNQPLHYGATGGVRFFAGGWFDAAHTFGMDGSAFFLGRQTAGFGVFDRTNTGAFVINEPVTGVPFSTQVSAPGFDTGGATVTARSRFMGGDVNFLYNLYRWDGWTINLLGGYRYLELDESLSIAANSLMFVSTTYTDSAGNVLVTAPAGSTIMVTDRFATRNYFNGGQLGASVQYALNRWFFTGTLKVAMGVTHEMVTIDGNTTVYPVGGNPVPLIGGNFATLQIGRYAQNRFAVAPDLQLNVGYQVTPLIRATVGYQFMYLSSVLRPGNQIDNTYDGVVHPTVPLTSSGFWAQGLNFGVQVSY
jgi:hypothetical protein